MIGYRELIFKLFPPRDNTTDVNKDVNGKGTLERYNEVVGLSLDEEVVPLIDSLVDNVIAVDSCESKFLPMLEDRVGSTLGRAYYATTEYKRAVLKHVISFYKIKGTSRLLTILLGMRGLGSNIIEHFNESGLDSSMTFDDPVRVFDMACNTCGDFTLELFGSDTVLSPEDFAVLIASLRFNTPINVNLRACLYNGQTAVVYDVYITHTLGGALVYSNPYDPSLSIQIINGQLDITSDLEFYEIINQNQIRFVFLGSAGGGGSMGSFSPSFSNAFG